VDEVLDIALMKNKVDRPLIFNFDSEKKQVE